MGYTAALLVAADSDTARLEGLTVLRMITQAEGERVIDELLGSRDVLACKLW